MFASVNGARLNALLLKVLARYSLLKEAEGEDGFGFLIDGEAAEHAVFSLYLMSSYGFHVSNLLTLAVSN